ncbi:unnamed protein product [Rhodiola kirilowii]
MAMQAGMGLSRIVILAGAGYTGSVLLKNGKLSDVLAELQGLLKKTGEDSADPVQENIALQIKRLTNEVLSMKTRQITVYNGSSGTDIISYLPTVAVVGAAGYGYMWWKGISFSDMMYVTKRNMEKAVTNLTSHLGQVSDALESAKKHLTQRIQRVDDQVKLQIELSRKTGEQIDNVQRELSQVGCNVADIQSLVYTLEDKMGVLEKKQDFANAGVAYLINFANGERAIMPDNLPEQLQLPESSNPRMLAIEDAKFLTGLKGLMDELDDDKPRHLTRTVSSRC